VPTRGLDDAALRAAFRQVITTRVPYYGGYVKSIPRLPPTADRLAALPMVPPTSAP